MECIYVTLCTFNDILVIIDKLRDKYAIIPLT